MLLTHSHAAGNNNPEHDIPADFSRLPDEIQDVISRHVNPAIIRIFSQYVHSNLSSTQPIEKEITFFASQDNNSVHQQMYFEHLEKNEAVALAEQFCKSIEEKVGITITSFEYFETANKRYVPRSMDEMIQEENTLYDKRVHQSKHGLSLEALTKGSIAFLTHLPSNIRQFSAGLPAAITRFLPWSKDSKQALAPHLVRFADFRNNPYQVYHTLLEELRDKQKLGVLGVNRFLKEKWLLAIQNSYFPTEGLLDYTPISLFPISKEDLVTALEKIKWRTVERVLSKVPETVLIALWEWVAPLEELPEPGMVHMVGERLLTERAMDLATVLADLPFDRLAEIILAEDALREESRQGLMPLTSFLKRVEPRILVSYTPQEVILMTASLYAFRKEYALLEKLYERREVYMHEAYCEPLIFYAYFGHLEKVQSLLRQQTQAKVLIIALEKASEGGYIKVVKILINSMSRQKKRNKFIKNKCAKALSVACKRGHLEVVQYLLHIGVPVGSWHFNEAYQNGQVEITRELLNYENKTDEFESFDIDNALQWAAGKGYLEMMQLLLQEPRISKEGMYLALYCAAGMGQVDPTKELLHLLKEEPLLTDYMDGIREVATENRHVEIVYLLEEALEQKESFGNVQRSFHRPGA